MIKPLPHWVLTDSRPAFYDTESATAIQQTAKLYGAMQDLITAYNTFETAVNEHIAEQDKDIADAIEYMKTNLVDTLTILFNDALKNGSINGEFVYDSEKESLTLNLKGQV